MRYRSVVTRLALVLAACTGAAESATGQPLRVEAGETYVELHPADGFLFIREYYLATLETDSATIAAQAADVAVRVQNRRYCGDRYGFTGFTSMEERMYRERGFVAVECRLLTRERNLRVLGEDAFGRLLHRPVQMGVVGDEIHLRFDGADVQVRGNNALALRGRGTEQMVVWRNGATAYEVVFGPAGRPNDSFRSLAPFVRSDVASPEVSPAEIEAWRRGP